MLRYKDMRENAGSGIGMGSEREVTGIGREVLALSSPGATQKCSSPIIRSDSREALDVDRSLRVLWPYGKKIEGGLVGSCGHLVLSGFVWSSMSQRRSLNLHPPILPREHDQWRGIANFAL